MTQQREAREAFLDALVYDDPVLLYERAPCGFLSTTPDGLIVKANATFRTWIGLEADDLVGRSFGLTGADLYAVVVLGALPAAQNVHVIATRYAESELLARDVVFWSTILSVASLLVVAATLGPSG